MKYEDIITSHASWGPEGEKLSDEEKAKVLKDMWNRVAAQRADTIAVPRSQLKDIYKRFCQLTSMRRMTIEQWMALPEGEQAILRKVFQYAEFGSLFAGQWLTLEDKNKVREELKENEQ